MGKKVDHHDGEGGGGCGGGCAGCLVLVIAGAVVCGMLILTPYLREHNWTKEGIREYFYSLRNRIEHIIQEVIDKAKDTIEHPSDAAENFRDLKEEIKDGADQIEDSFPRPGSSASEMPAAEPYSKKSTEEPAVLPGAETPNLDTELIED